MPLDKFHLRDLLQRLASQSLKDRSDAADSVSDWISAFNSSSGELVSRMLEIVLRTEDNSDVIEAQLHALAELDENGLVPRDVIERVLNASVAGTPQNLEYIEHLKESII